MKKLEHAILLLKEIEKNKEQAYIVGGFVRDMLLLKPCIDIDICTSMEPFQLKKIFQVVKENYGSCVIRYLDDEFEVTTFRKEIGVIQNRYPEKIEYIKSLKEDLKRRDFTINTLCMDSSTHLIDLLNGYEDLRKKKIRTVGNPDIRIDEDSLRILRAIRLATTLNFQLDESLISAIEKKKSLLKNLSYQRKKDELDKIWKDKNFVYGRRLLKITGLEDVLEIPKLKDTVFYPDSLLIWMQLEVDEIYPFTKQEKKQMKYLRMCQQEPWNIYRIYESDVNTAIQIGLLKEKGEEEIRFLKRNLPIQTRNDVKITSKELEKIVSKNKISSTYQKIEQAILERRLQNRTEEIIHFVKFVENKK